MRWIQLAMDDDGRPAPDFKLESNRRSWVSLAQYRGRSNLVLFFSHGLDCQSCQDLVANIAAHSGDYEAENAQVLIVSPGSAQELPDADETPFPVLADPDNKTYAAYAALLGDDSSQDWAMVFILDRFGAPYAAVVGQELDEPSIHEDIRGWLEFIGIQCPECGVSHWPVETW